MAHVTYGQGILPTSWFSYPSTPTFYYFRKVLSLPKNVEEMGMSFTPREFSYFYWNCRRLQLTYSANYKIHLLTGRRADETYTKSYKVPICRSNYAPYNQFIQKTQEKLLIGRVVPDAVYRENAPLDATVPEWDCSSRRIQPGSYQGGSYGHWYSWFDINGAVGSRNPGILVTDDVVPKNYDKKIIWPQIYGLVAFFSNGFGVGADTYLPNDRSNLYYQQRGNFHFLDFPAVPMYVKWPQYYDPATYFSIDLSTFDMRVSWPKATAQERDVYCWPYADQTDARYHDGLNPTPDERGNF